MKKWIDTQNKIWITYYQIYWLSNSQLLTIRKVALPRSLWRFMINRLVIDETGYNSTAIMVHDKQPGDEHSIRRHSI